MRVFPVLVLLPVMTSIPCAAQSDNELLQAILCEIRELRSSFLQSQMATPMLDANRREREFALRRLDDVIYRERETQERLRNMMARLNDISQRLRDLQRGNRNETGAEELAQTASLEDERRALSETIPQVQGDISRAAGESSALRARISELETEYGRLQAQMRSLAANSSSVCDSSRR